MLFVLPDKYFIRTSALHVKARIHEGFQSSTAQHRRRIDVYNVQSINYPGKDYGEGGDVVNTLKSLRGETTLIFHEYSHQTSPFTTESNVHPLPIPIPYLLSPKGFMYTLLRSIVQTKFKLTISYLTFGREVLAP